MTAELEARRIAAAAVLADYDRDDNRTLTPPEWTNWAMRLGAELRSLLEQLGAETDRDPDMEHWLRHQLYTARPQAPDDADLDAIRKLAAMADGTVGETVARWLRQARGTDR